MKIFLVEDSLVVRGQLAAMLATIPGAEIVGEAQSALPPIRDILALRYLEDPRRTVTDITFSLGFSQPSAFTRAFKRWTGRSPTDHRTMTRRD